MKPLIASAADLWALIERTASCWLWRGPVRPMDGRPMAGSKVYARAAVWAASGRPPLAPGHVLWSTCNNGRCVRPEHAEPMTRGEEGRQRREAAFAERFWSRIDKNGPVHPVLGTPCWPWMGRCDSNGYGLFDVREDSRRAHPRFAHRIAYALIFGPLPSGIFACHHCDNPPCCNPAHLFPGTNADNVADMWSKGRGVTPTTRAA